MIREIQELRRNQGLGLIDRVTVKSPWLPENKKLIAWIKVKTLAESIEKGDSLELKKV